MTEITLPAVKVKVPQVGLIVYVSEKTGMEDGKHTCMFTAEIALNGRMELQSFHLRCRNEKEAQLTAKTFADRLRGSGPFPFIRTKFD